MAHKSDLVKIGMEGFAMIDQFFPRAGTKPRGHQNNGVPHVQRHGAARVSPPINYYMYRPQESHVHYATPVSATEGTVVRSNDLSAMHEGVSFNDYSRRRSSRGSGY